MNATAVPITIRPYRPDDNERLITFCRGLDVPARVQLGVDRSPDFCAFHQTQGGSWDILVAESGFEIIGFIDMSHIPYRLNNEVVQATYANLTGVQASWRKTDAFVRLVKESRHLAGVRGSAFSFALINIRNQRLERFLLHHYRDSRRGDSLSIYCILLGPRYRLNREFSYSRAAPRDLPEIMDLLHEYYSNFNFAPLINHDTFSRLAGFTINNIFIARDRRNRILASLGVWDQSSLRHIRVMKYDWPTLVLQRLLNAGRYFSRCARLPDPGQYLHFLMTIFPAAAPEGERAFSGLVRYACGACADRRNQFLILALSARSPLRSVVRGLMKITNVNIPIIIPLTESFINLLPGSRELSFHLEYALL